MQHSNISIVQGNSTGFDQDVIWAQRRRILDAWDDSLGVLSRCAAEGIVRRRVCHSFNA